MKQPVVQSQCFRLLVAIFLLVLCSAPISASPEIEPGGPGKLYLPVVLKQANLTEPGAPDEPANPDEPVDVDGIPGFELALDPDGQPVRIIGVRGGASGEIVQVIVQLADPPFATYQGGIPGLHATTPAEGQFLDVESSSARTYAAYLSGQRAMFETLLASTIPGAVIAHEFNGMVMQGMAVSLRRDQIAALEHLPGVTQVMVVREHRPLLEFSLPLIDVPELWDQVGGPSNAGAGQRIAIIDTGIDIENPFFNDAGFSAPYGFPKGDPNLTNDKVIVARAYFTGVENPCGAGNPITPRDFHGHGTHVAGIAAGNYNTPVPGTMSGEALSGVAPRAFLMSYNVFPCGIAGASDVDVIAAIEDAVADGATVINLNLGHSFAGRIEDDLLVQAIENAIAANVVFSIAAGNEGHSAETVGSPGVAPNAITVGASTTEAVLGHAINVTQPLTTACELRDIFALEGTRPPLASDRTALYISTEQALNEPTACLTLTAGSLTSQIALVRRGDCSFDVKVRNVANAGAVAAVIYNHLPGQGAPAISDRPESMPIPAFTIGNDAGLNLENCYRLSQGTAKMEIRASKSWFGRVPDAVAGFSGRGPNPNWAIKPDLVAPGVDILSSTQDDPLAGCCTDSSGYTRLSGTSVSAAHVAGAAALMRQRWSWLSAYALRSALMITAKTPVWRSDGFAPPPAQVMERGSGRIDLGADLIGKPAFIYPPSHSFGSHNVGNGPVTVRQSFTISPWTSNRTWNLAVVETAGSPNLRVTISPSTLYVDSPKSFTLQVQASTNVSPGEYEGFVRLTSGITTLRVPYWIRIVNVPIPPGNVLLVDDDRNSEDCPQPPPTDCSANYINALNTLRYNFTYWDTRESGTPTQADMERTSAVIWFTCRDRHTSLNFLAPIEGTEATELQNYLEAGGRLFVTGQDIAYGSAPSFVAGLGARFCSDPLFNTDTIPTPSIRGTGNALVEPVAGGKQFDIASGCPFFVDEIEPLGDGAVPILFALPPNRALCQGVVGVKNSSEPTLEAPQEYLGRSVYLSFGFEDINDAPDSNGREELMKNILDWLQDDVSVVVRCAVDGRTVDCIAALAPSAGPAPARFRWDLGDGTTLSTGPSASIVHRYGSPGTFTIRIEATDSWGHKALDDARVTVR